MSKNKPYTSKGPSNSLSLPEFKQLNPDIQRAVLSIPESDHYFIALSGGLDSMALLLFVLPYLRAKNKSVQALHIHHGLSPNADSWAIHCQTICRELDVTLHVERVLVKAEGKGLEAAARKARYKVFEAYLTAIDSENIKNTKNIKKSVLLQGHHLNDQAETVLMRMLRGAGSEGLRGIPQQRVISDGILYRPWLKIPRAVLKTEFVQTGIKWIEDDSNTNLQFDRNYIRHQVLPIIQQRWPNTLFDLKGVSERAQETQNFLKAWCQKQENKLLNDVYSKQRALSLSGLEGYSDLEQHFLVHYWLDLLNIPHPSEKIFIRLWTEVIGAAADAQPEIRWGDYRIRRFDDCLFLLTPLDLNHKPYEHSFCLSSVVLPVSYPLSCGTIEFSQATEQMLETDVESEVCFLIKKPKAEEKVIIRSRRGGETIHLPGFTHAKALKKVFQTRKVLPWLRSSLPLLYYGDDLVFVGSDIVASGVVAAGFETEAAKNALLIRIRKIE